jgi:NADH dehydrogenase [ubiquinone] 1 alpha subcomplex assembly factor 6
VGRRSPLSPPAQLLRRHDRDRFLTALFAPPDRREAVIALYAFNYEVARVREMVREPLLGRMRLQWWRDSIAAAYDGGPILRHEVAEPLTAAIRMNRLSRAHFEALIATREADLDDAPPPDLAALAAYADGTSARLVLLALEALDVHTAAAAAAGHGVGVAYALAGLLRAIPFHARARRLYLPADLTAAAGIDISRGLFELKSSPALSAVVAQVAEVALSHLAAARALGPGVPRPALPALLPGVIAENWLRRLARAGYDPFARGLARPDGLQTVRLAIAARRGRY